VRVIFYFYVFAAGSDDLLDLIFGMQSKRMDEQRASLPDSSPEPDDDKFFDMLIRCQVSTMISSPRFQNNWFQDNHALRFIFTRVPVLKSREVFSRQKSVLAQVVLLRRRVSPVAPQSLMKISSL